MANAVLIEINILVGLWQIWVKTINNTYESQIIVQKILFNFLRLTNDRFNITVLTQLTAFSF